MELARPATDADRASEAALLGRALESVRAQRGGAILAANATWDGLLAEWTSRATAVGRFVGEFDQAVVGLGVVSHFTRPGANEPSGRIECCYVEVGARGVGVGTALMEAMVAWCVERGCCDIDALALPGDRAAKQRLEAAGFSARLLTLNRRLD